MIQGHLLLITKVHFNSKIQFLDLLGFSQIIMIILSIHTMHAIVKLGEMKLIKQNKISKKSWKDARLRVILKILINTKEVQHLRQTTEMNISLLDMKNIYINRISKIYNSIILVQ